LLWIQVILVWALATLVILPAAFAYLQMIFVFIGVALVWTKLISVNTSATFV
jgi:hypothetical protein